MMSAELIVLSVGAAAAALIVTRVLSLRADARGDARSTGRARDVLGRGGTAAHRSGPAGGGPTSARASQEIHHVPAPRGGTAYDPRPSEDKARRRIAYLLIALLVFMIVALLAAAVFGAIPVDEIKEFGVILGPLVALVSAATGFYFATKR